MTKTEKRVDDKMKIDFTITVWEDEDKSHWDITREELIEKVIVKKYQLDEWIEETIKYYNGNHYFRLNNNEELTIIVREV